PLLLFFLSSSAAHPDLHSFPTRRSSDLGTLVYNWAGSHTVPYVISGSGAVTKSGAGTVTFTAAHTYAGNTTVNAGAMVVGTGGIDRKSTRLNSSHLVISYAVFCLKKKKK